MDETLKELIADILGLEPDEISDTSDNQRHPEWDSMAQVNLSAALEEEYKLKLSVDEMTKLTSVSAISEILTGHTEI